MERFVLFHAKRHPKEMGAHEVSAFLSHLAAVGPVSASTQNQALAALVLEDLVRARVPARLPVVLTQDEAKAVLAGVTGRSRLVVALLYGAGLRLLECLRLRVKGLDLERQEIVVRNGKGRKDRVTVLPLSLAGDLRAQLAHARAVHASDLQGRVRRGRASRRALAQVPECVS